MPRWELQIHRRAERVLERLPEDVLRDIDQAIRSLSDDPRPMGCRKLVGYQNLYRIRVGDWRVVYAIEENEVVVLILEVAPRGGAYRHI